MTNKFSIITPTMWKYPPHIRFLEDLVDHDYVDEIILINNDQAALPKNCGVLTHSKIKIYNFLEIEKTNFGNNAGSFLHGLSQAITLPSDTNVYFVEDDYIHHEGSDIILEQGLERSPYVSLYDHPDKYWNKNSEKFFKILITEDCHWRTTGSTTMTFASKASFLKEDIDIFYKWCGGTDNWTHDTQLFTELSNKRSLITPIPGYATHLDSWVIANLVDWKSVLDRTTSK